MGLGRVLNEKMHQLLPGGSSDTEYTSNHRNEAMLAEVSRFDTHLSSVQAQLTAFVTGTRTLSRNTRTFMHSPLPRVWDYPEGVDAATHTGISQPVGDEHVITQSGGEKHSEQHTIAGAQESLEHRLQNEVALPMQQWQSRYNMVSADMKALEAKRLEVDSRRRSNAKLEKKEAKLAEKAETPKEALKADEAHVTTARKELKAESYEVEWMEMENRIYIQLRDLIADAEPTRNLLKQAMTIVSESFAKATDSFNPSNEEFSAEGADEEQRRLDQMSLENTVAGKPTHVEHVPAGRPAMQPTRGGVPHGEVSVEKIYPTTEVREVQPST